MRNLSDSYPTDLPAWRSLTEHYRDVMQSTRIADLFEVDSNRFDGYSLEVGDLFLDFSKNVISDETMKLLAQLAREAGTEEVIADMFAGASINATEDRAVLHTALRSMPRDGIGVGIPGVADIWDTLAAMFDYVNAIQQGRVRGHTGQRLTEIVNIGIGGSDLGPVMASRALRHYWQPGMNFHSVSNVDGTQLSDLMQQLDPESTLFVICSKTFSTQETMTNACAASEWISRTMGVKAVKDHFAAASTNHEAMDLFGIAHERRFGFWDWVGGRYSLWSAVGLSLALVIGVDQFRALLNGAREMDQHFRSTPPEANMPTLLALIGIWYNNFFGAESHAILPYDNRLDRFPAYLQQLQMESNGKSIRVDGKPVTTQTGVVIWGEPGSNGQHSFYQLLHQGTRMIPVDFILPLRSSGGSQVQQDLAIANCLGQSEALMDGYKPESGESHRRHDGNRPSNILLTNRLTPSSLGQLIALYEHKVFVEGIIWGINSFDQYGVELGKRLAAKLATSIAAVGSVSDAGNASTSGLLSRLRASRDVD